MTDYDNMNTGELINLLEHDAVNGSGEKDAWAHRTQLILAIREHVIREASVGTAEIDVINGFPYTHIYISGLKSGDYDLVPRGK